LVTIRCDDTDLGTVSKGDICWKNELAGGSSDSDPVRSFINAVAAFDGVGNWASWGLSVDESATPDEDAI